MFGAANGQLPQPNSATPLMVVLAAPSLDVSTMPSVAIIMSSLYVPGPSSTVSKVAAASIPSWTESNGWSVVPSSRGSVRAETYTVDNSKRGSSVSRWAKQSSHRSLGEDNSEPPPRAAGVEWATRLRFDAWRKLGTFFFEVYITDLLPRSWRR